MASVSLRLRSVGGVGFEAGAAGDGSAVGCACGVGVAIDAGSEVSGCRAVQLVAAGSGVDAGSVFISTGLVDSASWPLEGRELEEAVGCAALVGGWSEGDAMAAG